MKMEAPINYYKESLKELEAIKATGKRPTLLFHVCCGPCSCFPLTLLCPHFDVTIYYANSNIYPSEEYDHRLSELKKLISYLKRDYGYEVKLIVPPYDNDSYQKTMAPYTGSPEGGERCFACYRLRMEESYAYAEAHGFDYFTTVMTVSRQKNSKKLNEIGAELALKYPKTKYFHSDFKKNHGLEIGTEIRKKYELYNQNYCGCKASFEEMKEREKRLQNRAQK